VSWRAALAWISIFLLLGGLGGGIEALRGKDDEGRSASEPSLGSFGRVVRVIDGDTIRVQLGDATTTVRYIGVDTPESVKPNTPVQCFAKQASSFNRRLVEGRRVRLRFASERFDRYGRLLAYVYVAGRPGRSVSATLIASGYGRMLAIPPNIAHVRVFSRLEEAARHRGTGLWSACRR
jgi:micrococcal nuclease